ncbi:uncharacterized protein TNCV_3953441 [Trichonephila clavipes]|nr:uncharacterized protein TNCV_3953441 [Trichonephila clavipes]
MATILSRPQGPVATLLSHFLSQVRDFTLKEATAILQSTIVSWPTPPALPLDLLSGVTLFQASFQNQEIRVPDRGMKAAGAALGSVAQRDHPSNYSILVKGTVAAVAEWYRYRTVACFVTGSSPVPLKTRRVGQRCTLNLSRAETSSRWCGVVVRERGCQLRCRPRHLTSGSKLRGPSPKALVYLNSATLIFNQSIWHRTATAGSDVVQSGRPIFDDFFQHLWPYIGNNTANVVFQMVKRLWLIRIDQ